MTDRKSVEKANINLSNFHLTNLVAVYKNYFLGTEVVNFLDFSKAFDTVSHDSLLTDKLVRSGQMDQRWVGVWLNCQVQGVVVNGSKSNW